MINERADYMILALICLTAATAQFVNAMESVAEKNWLMAGLRLIASGVALLYAVKTTREALG